MSAASGAGMSAATAAIAGPATAARVPSVVSRSIAAIYRSAPTVTATAVAAVDVGRVVARSATPPTVVPAIASAIASAVTPASPARAVATRHQSCEEHRYNERHF